MAAARPAKSAHPSDKPAPPVKRFDADALDRPAQVVEPFPFTVNGHHYELRDPREVDWQLLMAGQQGDNLQLLQGALPEAQVHRFFREKVEAWRMEAIVRAYLEHADAGNFSASPTS